MFRTVDQRLPNTTLATQIDRIGGITENKSGARGALAKPWCFRARRQSERCFSKPLICTS
jgi:hypothetical protein